MIRYHSLKSGSLVDGPDGPRAVLHFQGCPIRCAGCQNQALWPEAGGRLGSPFFLAMRLATVGRPVTITGGEPFAQPAGLLALLRYLRLIRPETHVIVYTGYTLEALLGMAAPEVQEALRYVDVLVDGPYIADLDDDALQWRGSRNQRAIDVPAFLEAGRLVALDWDTPALTLSPGGDVLGAAALLAPYMTLGAAAEVARCGQV